MLPKCCTVAETGTPASAQKVAIHDGRTGRRRIMGLAWSLFCIDLGLAPQKTEPEPI
jgi:hypothetical protein